VNLSNFFNINSISYYVRELPFLRDAIYFQVNDITLPRRRNKSAILGAA